jgi:hypothetical protein
MARACSCGDEPIAGFEHNRLRREGVPREAARRLVNHASALVHEVYQREKVDDVMQWRDAVKFPITKTSLVIAA